MRIGAIYEWKKNVRYRVENPLRALERRGHEVAFSKEGEGALRPDVLRGRDLIHAYRALSEEELRVVARCVREGAAFVWDTDDDLSAVPKESPYYRKTGGLRAQRTFATTVQIARQADLVTASTEPLGERYRAAGVPRVEVLGNFLAPQDARSRRRRHEGFVIGWTAGLEHDADVRRVPLLDALRRLLEAHRHVRVATIGLRLDLPADRYEHHPEVPVDRLQEFIGRWDVGVAPLADVPFNRSRSDVKLKEYASVGIPWLASPVGPYAGAGEAQGGRLVEDDGWFEALDRLVRGRWERRRLARRARSWARDQSIDRFADRWERAFEEAVARRAQRAAA